MAFAIAQYFETAIDKKIKISGEYLQTRDENPRIF